LIEAAYLTGTSSGLEVWCTDQAGPYQTVPYPGRSWRPEGDPARHPHEYLRDGTAKALTLFRPADGRARVDGVTACPNAVLHPWLKRELAAILATMPDPPATPAGGWRGAWGRWQEGLTAVPTLPEAPPPLRMLLVLDDPAGHKTPELVCWLFDHGVMPLYTPVGGPWLNMAESLQRILKRRALDGQYPTDTAQIIAWYEAAARHVGRGTDAIPVGRQAGGPSAAAARAPSPPRRLGGLLARPGPAACRIMAAGKPSDPLVRFSFGCDG
jgi:DDE superfamily endonuclease